MHRLNICEELGRGSNRMVISCELQKLPAPRIQIYQESIKVSLFSHLDFTNIPMEDKIWATYLYACIKYIEWDALTNSSLRDRFGVAESYSGSISRLIKEVLNSKLIKPVDTNTAPRCMSKCGVLLLGEFWGWTDGLEMKGVQKEDCTVHFYEIVNRWYSGCILQVQGAAIYIDIAAPCTCPMDCLKKGVDVRFYGWRYGCSEEMYYLRGNQR